VVLGGAHPGKGGTISQSVAPPPLRIVLGGTLVGRVVSTPLGSRRAGMRSLAGVFFEGTTQDRKNDRNGSWSTPLKAKKKNRVVIAGVGRRTRPRT